MLVQEILVFSSLSITIADKVKHSEVGRTTHILAYLFHCSFSPSAGIAVQNLNTLPIHTRIFFAFSLQLSFIGLKTLGRLCNELYYTLNIQVASQSTIRRLQVQREPGNKLGMPRYLQFGRLANASSRGNCLCQVFKGCLRQFYYGSNHQAKKTTGQPDVRCKSLVDIALRAYAACHGFYLWNLTLSSSGQKCPAN